MSQLAQQQALVVEAPVVQYHSQHDDVRAREGVRKEIDAARLHAKSNVCSLDFTVGSAVVWVDGPYICVTSMGFHSLKSARAITQKRSWLYRVQGASQASKESAHRNIYAVLLQVGSRSWLQVRQVVCCAAQVRVRFCYTHRCCACALQERKC